VKKQVILAVSGFALVAVMFIFGRTAANKTVSGSYTPEKDAGAGFSIKQFITQAKIRLSPHQNTLISELENSVTRGDVLNQQIMANKQLAAFWKDSAHAFEPYIYYLSAASKLENSEKNLTFAAQLILNNLRFEQDAQKLNWLTAEAVELFEKAIALNPANDDLKIGLGSCYIYGRGRTGNTDETMKGIQQLLSVVRKDSNNMKAQMVLGYGGLVSGQYDKAIERLTKVVRAQPGNVEAIEYLASAYAETGHKAEAIKWYETMKRMDNNPEFIKEVNERIKSLQ
jgi:tetratricopeptide (TPR) repeat protein